MTRLSDPGACRRTWPVRTVQFRTVRTKASLMWMVNECTTRVYLRRLWFSIEESKYRQVSLGSVCFHGKIGTGGMVPFSIFLASSLPEEYRLSAEEDRLCEEEDRLCVEEDRFCGSEDRGCRSTEEERLSEDRLLRLAIYLSAQKGPLLVKEDRLLSNTLGASTPVSLLPVLGAMSDTAQGEAG
ncbi:hypothetical protein S40288_10484 [Stachybotrys chartarum IBT 40288]|nr:hypothetical protein S40288_10484 [Stachybotrys chartarum IBT 40288]